MPLRIERAYPHRKRREGARQREDTHGVGKAWARSRSWRPRSSLAAARADDGPIKIGVIAENQAVAGSSIPLAAQLAADEINAAGGVNGRKIEIVAYDNHSSSAESVRAFQRAVNDDHVNAVIASYVSEVVLALEPWAARLKTVMITPGAASDVITANIAKDYDANKYTFHGYLTSGSLSRLVCDSAKDMLVDGLQDEVGGRHVARTPPGPSRSTPAICNACRRSASRCSTKSASRPTPPTSRRSSTRSRA